MVYFFHHYELPAVEQQAHVHSLIALAQRQQTPQHLLTVMTRTPTGDLARTTADISELRPVTYDGTQTHGHTQTDGHTQTHGRTQTDRIDSTAQPHQHVDSPVVSSPQIRRNVDDPAVSLAPVTRDVDNLPTSEAQLRCSAANLPVCVSDVQLSTDAGPSSLCDDCQEYSVISHTTNTTEHVDSDLTESVSHTAERVEHVDSDLIESVSHTAEHVEHVDSDLTESVSLLPQSVTGDCVVSTHDSIVQSTSETVSQQCNISQ